jgi:hypothetical protein
MEGAAMRVCATREMTAPSPSRLSYDRGGIIRLLNRAREQAVAVASFHTSS